MNFILSLFYNMNDFFAYEYFSQTLFQKNNIGISLYFFTIFFSKFSVTFRNHTFNNNIEMIMLK